MSDYLGIPKNFSFPNFWRLSLHFQRTSSRIQATCTDRSQGLLFEVLQISNHISQNNIK